MLSVELMWFALSCAVGRYTIDTLLPLALTNHWDSEWSARDVVVKLVAAVVALVIVCAIVYGTVPWISNRIVALTPNNRLEQRVAASVRPGGFE